MTKDHRRSRRGATLIELLLVIGILAVIASLVVPNFFNELEGRRLSGSASQMRSFLAMVRANAAFDGKQYRLRFPLEDELDPLGGEIQPIVEREDNAIGDPQVFSGVTAPWAVGKTLLNGVRCVEVRLGRPTMERLRERESQSSIEEALNEAFADFDPLRPPLIIEPDGTSDWVTYVLTDAPAEMAIEDITASDEYSMIEVIMNGETGLAWLQRPLYDEELDMFEENGWPVVLRQDFLDPRVLTEDDVLELHDIPSGR